MKPGYDPVAVRFCNFRDFKDVIKNVKMRSIKNEKK